VPVFGAIHGSSRMTFLSMLPTELANFAELCRELSVIGNFRFSV
jgi:hypothetical protein